jgi:hypothetical protein
MSTIQFGQPGYLEAQERECQGGRWEYLERSGWERARPVVQLLLGLGLLGMVSYAASRVVQRGWRDSVGVALLGSGGGLTLIALSGLGVKHQRRETLRFASWNVGTANDGQNMADARATGLPAARAMKRVAEARGPREQWNPKAVAEERKAPLLAGLRELFQTYHCDVACLQETSDMSEAYLRDIVPAGMGFARLNPDGVNRAMSLVVWNPNRVRLVAGARLTYSEYMRNAAPDVIAMFQTVSGRTFTVCSTYCRGFNLNPLPSAQETSEQIQAKQALQGDYQTIYNVKTMDQVRRRVDFEFYAGDLNARQLDRAARRITYLQERGFQTVPDEDRHPTIFDAHLRDSDGNPLPVRLDHGYIRHGRRQATIASAVVSSQSLQNLKRPSDHIPIGFDVRF